jgi:hypothetical protein
VWNYFKTSIEKEKTYMLCLVITLFLAIYSLFIYLGFLDLYLYPPKSNLICFMLFVIFISFLFLFFVCSCMLGELISRIRAHKFHNNMHGWIFIDALVGIVIVTTALTCILLAYTQLTKATILTTNKTQALYIAQQALEYFKFNDGQTAGTVYPNFAYQSSVTAANGSNYTVSVNQSVSVNVNGNTKIYPVQVSVKWNNTDTPIMLTSYYYLK